MAHITRKRQGEMLQAIFQILRQHPDGIRASEVIEEVEKILPPTEFELEIYPNQPGQRRFDKILRFSTIGAVKAGWMVKARGIWSITEEGEAALVAHPKPEALFRETVRLYNRWKASQKTDAEIESPGDADVATATLEEAEESAWATLRDYLRDIDPYVLQDLVGALLEAMGYHVAWIAPRGKDRGIDIVANTDPLGANTPRIKVQV